MRVFTILWAYVRCQVYLLFYGMWQGECQFEGYKDDKLVLLAAAKGNIDEGYTVYKVFYAIGTMAVEALPVTYHWIKEVNNGE